MNWKYGEPHEWRCAQAFMLGKGHRGLREVRNEEGCD